MNSGRRLWQGIIFFPALAPEDIAKLAGYASHIYMPRHHLIGLQEKSAHALWLLMPGSTATLHVVDGKDERSC